MKLMKQAMAMLICSYAAAEAETIPFSERKGYADMTYGVYDGSKL